MGSLGPLFKLDPSSGIKNDFRIEERVLSIGTPLNLLAYGDKSQYRKKVVVNIIAAIVCGIGVIIAAFLKAELSKFEYSYGKAYINLYQFLQFSVGILIGLNFVSALTNWLKIKKFSERTPDKPWDWDFPWEESGMDDLNRFITKKRKRSFIVFFNFAILVTLLNYFSFGLNLDNDYHLQVLQKVLKVGVTPFVDIIFLFGIFFRYRFLVKQFQYGRCWCEYDETPYSLGSKVKITVFGLPLNKGIDNFIINLRLIKEKGDKKSKDENLGASATCIEILHSEVQMLAAKDCQEIGQKIFFDTSKFPVISTNFIEMPMTYWELEITSEIENHGFAARFLLPIYSTPEDIHG